MHEEHHMTVLIRALITSHEVFTEATDGWLDPWGRPFAIGEDYARKAVALEKCLNELGWSKQVGLNGVRDWIPVPKDKE